MCVCVSERVCACVCVSVCVNACIHACVCGVYGGGEAFLF